LSNRRKNTIRAVTAALLFSALVVLLLGGRPNPMRRVLGACEVCFQARRLLYAENLIISSDAIQRWKTSERGKRILKAWGVQRDRFKSTLGDAFDWIGWGPFRVAIALSADQPPVIAVGAGYFAPFGEWLLGNSGFKPSDPVEGYESMQKEHLTFVRVKDLWIIGPREIAAKTVRALDNSATPTWWKLPSSLANKADVSIAISPSVIQKLLSSKNSSPTAENLMKEWLDVDNWGGALVAINLKRRDIAARAWLPLEKKKPIVRLWRQLGRGSVSPKWLHPQTLSAARLVIDNPPLFWEKAKEIFAKRPMPSNYLWQIEQELDRELNIKLSDLLGQIRREVGFINFLHGGKVHTVLFTGVPHGVEASLRHMQKGVIGTWQSSFKGISVTYMPRLLTYGIQGERLLLATDPKLLGAYVKGVTRPAENTNTLDAALRKLSGKPLLLAGGPAAGKKAGGDVRHEAGRYVAGVDYKSGRFEAQAITPVVFGAGPSIPWGPRLLAWGEGIAETLGWLFAALTMAAFLSNLLSLNPKRHVAAETTDR